VGVIFFCLTGLAEAQRFSAVSEVTGEEHARACDRILYSGSEWEGAVEVFANFQEDGIRLGDYSPPSFFDSSIDFLAFPRGPCRARIWATGGGVERSVELFSFLQSFVVFTEGAAKVNGARCLAGGEDFTCEGDRVCVGADSVFVADRGGSAEVLDSQTGVRFPDGGLFIHEQQTVYLGLCGDRLLRLISSLPTPDIEQFDPINEPGVQHLPEEVEELRVEGFARRQGDLLVRGQTTLEGGVLYVTGTLTITGGATGRGGIFVNGGGSTQIAGIVNLQPENQAALLTRGDLFLFGIPSRPCPEENSCNRLTDCDPPMIPCEGR